MASIQPAFRPEEASCKKYKFFLLKKFQTNYFMPVQAIWKRLFTNYSTECRCSWLLNTERAQVKWLREFTQFLYWAKTENVFSNSFWFLFCVFRNWSQNHFLMAFEWMYIYFKWSSDFLQSVTSMSEYVIQCYCIWLESSKGAIFFSCGKRFENEKNFEQF